MNQSASGAVPWHFWAFGIVGLVWNAFGAFDFTMSMLRDPGFLGNFPPEILQFLDSMSAWEVALWGIGVWGAVIGSILLLARSRLAVLTFLISLLGATGSFVFQFTRELSPALDTPAAKLVPLVATVVAVFLLWYANRARHRGLLR